MTDYRFAKIPKDLPSTVPFVGPEALERKRGLPFATRLGANESVFGPSPEAIAAMAEAAKDVWKYGDPENYDLKQSVARHFEITPDQVVVGEGIDALLGYAVRLFVDPGDVVVTSDGAYPTFNYHVTGFGGELRKVPYRNDHEDPEALLEAAHDSGAKLVYLANPDNPMGTWQSVEAIRNLAENLPEGTLLVLDEAYAEFASPELIPEVTTPLPNTIRFRTFSKAYGMAGARIGYAIGPSDLVQAFDRIRNHFGVSRIAQAGALAALKDQDYLSDINRQIAIARNRIYDIAVENDLSPIPSAANFVALDCGQDGRFAKSVLDGLIAENVFVRMPYVAPQDRCVRITAGREAELDYFASALSRVMRRLRNGG